MNIQNQSGLLGFGTYQMQEDSLEKWVEIIETAYQSKYAYIDTAKYYKNEAMIGQALELLRTKYGPDFHFPVQTKIWPGNYPKARAAVLDSLKKLRLEQLDSVLLHWPSPNFAQDLVAWEALIQLQKEGLIKSIGVSNYPVAMLGFFAKITGVMPATNQLQYSLYNQEYDLQAFKNLNVHVQAWRPLTDSLTQLHQDSLVNVMAQKYKTTPPGIALAFVKAQNVDVIVKSVNPHRIKANAEAYFNVNLATEDLEELVTTAVQKPNRFFWTPYLQPLGPTAEQQLLSQMTHLQKCNNSWTHWLRYPIYWSQIAIAATGIHRNKTTKK
ncbi:2,5-diketo-D-gluconate reductase A [Mycoplasmoides fastidiosum]|uniref:2,5-diketo-D-gluconate reductase A n=1 Tax=Mycoplasmoides fastidiosum TaxID=92758 RepID=A0ABU0M0G5_9BACT|nr:aldo/keto reductase [Mycoplasmoides fastidiosum]MDQ0514335.1 2,5-diketo-D-gluconate reductase A [Mycoplasmoides fastidiosum]UUD38062.1 aldo/keto reductase [Mycoplasmoides fastidiosum]